MACCECPGKGIKVWPSDREWDHKHLPEDLVEIDLHKFFNRYQHIRLVLRLLLKARAGYIDRIIDHIYLIDGGVKILRA